jgi:predicted ATPase
MKRSRWLQKLSHPLNLAHAELFVGVLRQYQRAASAAQENAESVIALSSEHGLTDHWATGLRGWAMAEQGRSEEGIAQLREGLAASRATEAGLWRPYFLCLLAEAWRETGRLDDGLNALTEALAATDEHEIRFYEAEAHRFKGELLSKQDDSNAAEAQSCLERAIEIARTQSAKSLELRATMSLARLLRNTARRDEARAMLAEIYGWFTEGFDTPALNEAKTMLDELSSKPALLADPTNPEGIPHGQDEGRGRLHSRGQRRVRSMAYNVNAMTSDQGARPPAFRRYRVLDMPRTVVGTSAGNVVLVTSCSS